MKFLKKYISKFYFQNFYERPSKRHRECLLKKWGKLKSTHSFYEKIEHHAQHLVNQGYTILPEYYKGSLLSDLKSDFESFACNQEADQYKQLYISKDNLENSKSLSEAVVDLHLMELVEYYFGKPFYLAELQGKRSYQAILPDYGNNMWHHDAKRKQVKIFILLTNVLPDGQHLDLIPKTHKIWHDFSSYEDTRFDNKKIKHIFDNYGDAVKCTGSAGTVIIFDTNMLHRANRNGSNRDVWVFNYTAGRSLFPIGKPHPDAVKNYSSKQKAIARV